MSDMNQPSENSNEVEYPSNYTYDVFQDTMDTYLATADVGTVYGEPFEKDGNVIIPAAEIVAGFGFGLGSAQGASSDSDETGSGSGAGGGGSIFSRPVAVIIASSEGVRIEPVLDITKIALAGLTTGAFMLATLLRIKNYKNVSKVT
jgi:uncharacterized spore protein YtfJ